MRSIRYIIKRITNPILKKGLQFYYRKPRVYHYKNIKVNVHPDVFPPHLTFSTKILLDFISTLDLKEKTLLELGCGSGIISLFAAKQGARVTATDISKIALNYLDKNAHSNKIKIKIMYSDLFDSIKNLNFDYIIINPPYYPKKPINVKEQAWFCGENFEYFESLFEQLSHRVSNIYHITMILSQDCEIDKIIDIANKNKLEMTVLQKVKKISETNYIYNIKKVFDA